MGSRLPIDRTVRSRNYVARRRVESMALGRGSGSIGVVGGDAPDGAPVVGRPPALRPVARQPPWLCRRGHAPAPTAQARQAPGPRWPSACGCGLRRPPWLSSGGPTGVSWSARMTPTSRATSPSSPLTPRATCSRFEVMNNQEVRAGDVIARIDDGDYRLALQAAQNRLATQESAHRAHRPADRGRRRPVSPRPRPPWTPRGPMRPTPPPSSSGRPAGPHRLHQPVADGRGRLGPRPLAGDDP